MVTLEEALANATRILGEAEMDPDLTSKACTTAIASAWIDVSNTLAQANA